jgi:recombination protein RecT
MNTETKAVVKVDKNITDDVLRKVNEFEKLGELKIPSGYSPGNALKSAYLILQDTQTRDKRPVLEACTKVSIASALLDMVVQGLNPMKKQCDFIAYGDKLTLQREYHGTIALAKRYGDVLDVSGNVIYEKDVFEYEINSKSGKKLVTKHEQKIENIDGKIIGAYATLIMVDGTIENEIMSMKMIQAAWNQGATKGQSPAHKNFPDQMSIKTAINRACKLKITTSDDSVLNEDTPSEKSVQSNREVIAEKANQEEVGFDESEEVEEKKSISEKVTPEMKKELVETEEWMKP